ncbi:alkaline phosphatase family protein [Actinopolymorpha sp. B17G11]|uniref:alkaline phosphatase family protein n=1 Tax=unclassified Actinopolymorpha TaxID=2627063 RepID=UPI0032D9572D
MSDDQARARSRRVVVFGVDGVRYDTLQAAHTPRIDAIGAQGFLTPLRVNAAGPTISGPCWSTMATGVLAPTNNIANNDMRGHRLDEHPDFLTRVRQEIPGARTYAAANWPPLVSEAQGGPIFRGGGDLVVEHPDHGIEEWEVAETTVAADAVKVLGSEDITAAFVYFGSPDGIAHEFGVCPDYTAAIERSDARIGQVLDTILARPTAAQEHWTVIVATDHGHVDAGGHGGDSPEERTAWMAAYGPTVPTTAPADLEQADVCAQVLTSLGIPLDPSWELVGRPFTR